MTEFNQEPLFEHGDFAVYSAKVPVNVSQDGEPMWVDGYKVVHTVHGQANGEFRAFAEACVMALQWDQTLKQVRQAASGLVTVKPEIKTRELQ